MIEESVCCGCFLNPNFIVNYPYLQDYSAPSFKISDIPNMWGNASVKLTKEESQLLQKLGECWNLFCSLDKRSEADNKEFVDSIHRAQQIIALRVARRVDPEVWAQPA